MLLRRDERGHLAIGQPSHAWISGQLARAWGNGRFAAPEPYEEVCLAAEQHDIGMASWDLDPSRNPDSGLPHAFTEMPLAVHLKLWHDAPRRLLRQSRYAALLVSMHGARLYERRDLSRLPSSDARQVRAFLEEQAAFQRTLVRSLAGDPGTSAAVGPDRLETNSRLIWTWDSLSLAICLHWAPYTLENVPAGDGFEVALTLSPGSSPDELQIDPWPFSRETLTVRCEGQRLIRGAGSDAELERMLADAAWESLEFTLTAAER